MARLAGRVEKPGGARKQPRTGLGHGSWPGWLAGLKCLAARLPWPHTLFAAASVAKILVMGYHFGTWDHTLYLPLLKHSVDPTLYPSDPFLALGAAHTAFFWDLFAPAYRAGVLELAVFVAYVLVTYLTSWSIWSLSQALFDNRLAAAVSVAALILPHIGLVGLSQVGFSLVAWIAVLPFTLWALTWYLRGRYLAAFGLLGVLYNFNALSVNFALGLLVLASLADLRRVGVRNLAGGLAIFVVAAAPVFIWRAANGPLDFSLRPEWVSALRRGINVGLYQVFGTQPEVLIYTASFAAMVALFVSAWRLAPARASRPSSAARAWMAGVVLVALAAWVAAVWLPVTFVIELQLGRIGVYATVLSMVYCAHYLARAYQAGRLGRAEFGALALALCLPPFAFLTLGLWGISRLVRSARWRPVLVAGLALTVTGASAALAASQGAWDPRVQVGAAHDDWYAAQVWARDNTPKAAVFMTPPQEQGFYTPSWRVFSERGTVATLDDLMDTGNTPGYFDVWQPRFEAVAPGALARFRGDIVENATLTAQAYNGLTDAQVLAVAGRYEAGYLVVAQPHQRPWPVAYANEGFIIYNLRGAR